MVPASPSDSMRAAILIPRNRKANIEPYCLVHSTLTVNMYKFAQGHARSYAHVQFHHAGDQAQTLTIAEPSLWANTA